MRRRVYRVEKLADRPLADAYGAVHSTLGSVHPILQLQQVAGNRNVDQLLQAKLRINEPRDASQQKADRKAFATERISDDGAIVPKVAAPPAIISDVLGSPGQALDPITRELMESRFGHDFSQVRIHTGARAAESARTISASAYTVGRNVVFGVGRYSPNSSDGQRLLAHELTHTIQQVGGVTNNLTVSRPTDCAEREAVQAAGAIVQGRQFSPATRHAPQIARDIPIPEDLRGEERARAEEARAEQRLRRQGRQAREAEAVESPREEGPGTILGGLMGEFNEDPSFAMIGVDLGVSLIPILDQASDVRDVIAHLYYLIAREQYNRFMRWLGLVFTLIGLFPEVGSAIKGASKFIIKGAREVIAHLADLLRAIRAVLPQVSDVGRLQAFLNRNWSRIITAGLGYWNRALARVNQLLRAAATVAGGAVQALSRGLTRVQQLGPRMLRMAFDWIRHQFDRVLNEVRERMGLAPSRVDPDVDEMVERAFAEHAGSVPPQPYSTTQRLIRGNLGERLAAEALAADGHHILSYKPSILGTNQGGIDIVTIRNGVVFLVDNKALTRSGNVGSVSALTTNFGQNLTAVRTELTAMLANAGSAGERRLIQDALNALNAGTFVRAVTNANVTPDNRILTGVTQQLQSQGIRFIDVMR